MLYRIRFPNIREAWAQYQAVMEKSQKLPPLDLWEDKPDTFMFLSITLMKHIMIIYLQMSSAIVATQSALVR